VKNVIINILFFTVYTYIVKIIVYLFKILAWNDIIFIIKINFIFFFNAYSIYIFSNNGNWKFMLKLNVIENNRYT